MSKAIIIIPCLNEEAHIKPLTLRLATNNPGTKIIIVDGGSSDHTLPIVQELAKQNPDIVLLNNPKRIQSAAINLAVKEYGQEATFFIRIDAHATYPDDYCQTLIDEAERTHAASVVVSMQTAGSTEFQRAIAAAQNSLLGNGGAAHRNSKNNGAWVDHGHHALIRINPFRAVGGYDESFSHNEDAELDARLIRARYRIWLTHKTNMIYYPRSSAWPLFRQYFYYGFGRARNILKHGTKPKLRQLAPAAILPAVILAIFNLNIFFYAWVLTCLLYGAFLAFRAKDPWIALSGPAAMVMHLGWSVGFWSCLIVNPRRLS